MQGHDYCSAQRFAFTYPRALLRPSQSEPSSVLLECAPSNFRTTLVACTHRLPLWTNYSLTSIIPPILIDNRRRISSEDRKAGASQGRSIEAQTIVRQA